MDDSRHRPRHRHRLEQALVHQETPIPSHRTPRARRGQIAGFSAEYRTHLLLCHRSESRRWRWNYSFLRAAVGIVQVISGSLQLYHALERHIPNSGYGVYSLTVIPYILMSLINLVACMCQPQYPTMLLVRYRGLRAPGETSIDNVETSVLPLNETGTDETSETEPELSGTIGEAYGDLSVSLLHKPQFTV